MITKPHLDDLLSSKIKWIDLADFEGLCFDLAKAHLSFDQPIPDFITRNPGILESCLQTPIQSFGGEEIYPTLVDKLAILFYLIIKNHPFQNGNKRIAVMAVLTILSLNGLWIKTNELEPYKFAIYVAKSKREEMNKMYKKIKKFIFNNLEAF